MGNFENQKENSRETISSKLEFVISQLPSGNLTLGQILKIIGNDSLMFVAIFLSLVFLVPVSIPGVSTVFGSAILLIGISQLFKKQLQLPDKIVHRTISSEQLSPVLIRALKWFRRFEKFSSGRHLNQLAVDEKIGLFNKLSFILAALLLMVPFGFIPFSNTLPAIALIFLAIGSIQ